MMFYHEDHLGGTNVLTDVEGEVKELIEYKPYGSFSRHEKYGEDEEVAWFYFTGKKLDDETGLYYYGARYYSPLIGRFIQADTVVPGYTNPQALNRYSYVLNNPINRVDPSGHWSFKKFFKSFVAGFVGAIVTAVTLGAGAPIAVALMAGGAAGGFVGGGWTDNGWSWKRAAIGAGVGGLTGFALGGGFGTAGVVAGWGAVVGGAGYTIATEGTDGLSSILGGIVGGAAGYGTGVAISKAINPNSVFNRQQTNTPQRQQQKNNNSLKTDQKPTPKFEVKQRFWDDGELGPEFKGTFDKNGNCYRLFSDRIGCRIKGV